MNGDVNILPILQNRILCFIIQSNERVLEPRPPVVDPLHDHMEDVRARARTLRKVDVRTENGTIIID